MRTTAKWPMQVTFRRARPADRAALAALAALDGAPPLVGDVLLAEVPVVGGRHDGSLELWAAASIDGTAAAADPFRPSGELALVVAERARAIRRAQAAAARPVRGRLGRLGLRRAPAR